MFEEGNMNNKGFTLVELLATIVVLGIIAAIVIVSMTGTVGRSKEKTEEVFIGTIKDALDVYLDSDDYEIEFYSDDVVLEDVVFASEDKEVEITDEDMENYLNKKQIREMLQTNYPNASLEEVVYWTQLLYKKHDISTISGDLIRRERNLSLSTSTCQEKGTARRLPSASQEQ